MRDTDNYKQRRETLVKNHIQSRGVNDPRVLDAMRQVPREQFLPEYLRDDAYIDTPLPIGSGQTISQPYIVALMTTALLLEPDDTVLEIGTGCGYAAAVLSRLCAKVYTIERIDLLALQAEKTLQRLEYENVEVITGDGTLGWPKEAPYSAIVATACGPRIPDSLKTQLAIGGRLIMPVGDLEHHQSLICLTRVNDTKYRADNLGDVQFVPLIGSNGWPLSGAHDPVR